MIKLKSIMLNGSLKLGVRLRKHGAYGWKMMSKMWGLEQESKMPAVNENLNRQLETRTEMLLNLKNRYAQPCSKVSEILDRRQHSPAQDLSNMSKKIPQARDHFS